MPCYSIDGLVPVVHASAYVHPQAVLIGDVIISRGVYIGPCAVLRGDFGRIELRDGSNLQDTCVVHSRPDCDTIIEEDGHIGHGAVIHAAHIGRNALVGMNAVVMDRAEIGENAIVAACTFVKIGMKVPAGTLVSGVPGRIIRDLSKSDLEFKLEGTKMYHELNRRSLASLKEAVPMGEIEAGRQRLSLPSELWEQGKRSRN